MEIIVVRGTGQFQGEDIVDPLLATELAAISRGRAELDKQSTINEAVTLEVLFRPGLETGQLVEVVDALQGTVWRGKITGIAHRINNAEQTQVTTTLNIERPTDFYLM